MGGMPAVNTWLSIMGWTLGNIAVASWLFAKYRRRVIYWL